MQPVLSRRKFLAASALAACAPLVLRGETAPDPIIDIHQHTHYGGKRDGAWVQIFSARTDQQLLAHQRAMGATKTILLPSGRPTVSATTHDGRSNGLESSCTPNDACARLALAYPREFAFGANEVPDLPDALQTIKEYLELGAVVIGEQKFGVECDSSAMQKIYELAQAYDVPVLMHWEFKLYNYGFERFHTMLDKYPKVKFIGHAQTFWLNIDREANQSVMYPKTKVTPGGITDRLLSDYPNLYADLSASSGHRALVRDEDFARGFLERHQDKLLFGSDCIDLAGQGSTCVGAQTIASVRKLAANRGIERKILHDNALQLFRL